MTLLQMIDKEEKTISEKLQVGKSFVDCYFSNVRDKLSANNKFFKSCAIEREELTNPEFVKHIRETYEYETDIRQQLLDLMVGGVDLLDCCIENNTTHGMNRHDRHLFSIGENGYESHISTYHFLYNYKLIQIGSGGWYKRLTYGGTNLKHYGYTGGCAFPNIYSLNTHKWNLIYNKNVDEVYSYILFGMMLDCMNDYSFHHHWLFSPNAKHYRCENKLEYEYHNPISGKKVGASLWKPFEYDSNFDNSQIYKPTLKTSHKYHINKLKSYIDEYNNLYSFHSDAMEHLVGQNGIESALDWYKL